MDLNELRGRIDAIDKELLPLFLERMDVAKKVADYKREHNIPVLDEAREKQLLQNKEDLLEDKNRANEVRRFFSGLMEISRDAQKKVILGDGAKTRFDDILQKGTPVKNPHIVFQGTEGAYSEQAVCEYFGNNSDRFHVKTFEDVFEAVASGKADYGMVPVENSYTGSVTEVLDLLEKFNLYITGEHYVPIKHCLLGVSGAEFSEIKTVYSHEQGIMQCAEFFKPYHDICFESYYNTAVSAKMVADLGDKTKAAIAGRRNAELYGLNILAENINFSDKNTTRFVVISKRMELSEKCNKISIVFVLKHESGSLYNAISEFAKGGLNLLKIESRPFLERNFEYRFFVDYSGNMNDFNVRRITENVFARTTSFKILGNFKAGDHA